MTIKKGFSVYFDVPNDYLQQEKYILFKELLEDLGVRVSEFEYEVGTKIKKCMTFDVDPKKVNPKLGRNAGRKKIDGGLNRYKYQDILDMQKELEEYEILTKLNISRSTYYRRLRVMKNILSKRSIADPKDMDFFNEEESGWYSDEEVEKMSQN